MRPRYRPKIRVGCKLPGAEQGLFCIGVAGPLRKQTLYKLYIGQHVIVLGAMRVLRGGIDLALRRRVLAQLMGATGRGWFQCW